MRRIALIAPLFISTLVSAQTGDTLGVAVEREFLTIYREFVRERGLKCQQDQRLDTVAAVQLEFLSRPENPYITHRHSDPDKRSASDRYKSVYGQAVGVSEIVVQMSTFASESPSSLAKSAFQAWYNSSGHRRIMTGQDNTAYSFRFGMNPYGRLVGIGVFIEE